MKKVKCCHFSHHSVYHAVKILVQVELEWRKSSGVKVGTDQTQRMENFLQPQKTRTVQSSHLREARVKLLGSLAGGEVMVSFCSPPTPHVVCAKDFVKPNFDRSKTL